ncbi:MAG: histidine phosphatase family protein [Planctomycetes bacterium]|nr:histidine phosphatase family protein [Planctomycetota bacterium]MCB9910440.1 histidine phosphatase family protein [Planctomycetota bacterium]MCB9912566.1 histidine phosphatase family protein [Planctomycetota bacterium]HRV83140.1 histidine phosphatase family protein [Planctomycetota bacterium]
MTEITLIRHGEVHADWRDRLYGGMDVPLSGEGEAQAWAVARELREEVFDGVISSGLARAEFTAAILRSSRPDLVRIDRPKLAERSRGDWAGLSVDEIDARHPGGSNLWRSSHGMFTPPGGESVEQVFERVLGELDRLAGEYEHGAIAVVAHLWVVRCAVAAAIGLAPERVAHLAVPTSGRVRLSWHGHRAGQGRGALIEMRGTPKVLNEDRAQRV